MTQANMFYLVVSSTALDPGEAENAVTPIAVGAAMPIYSPDYAGWQTELGFVPDRGQRYSVIGDGVAGAAGVGLRQKPPTVPIAHFFELFTVEEEQQARALAANNATLEIFFRRLALASTVNLEAYQDAITQVVAMLTCIAADKKAQRLAKILAGIAWWA